jgi:TM2 domain-containing membrane protein YozV
MNKKSESTALLLWLCIFIGLGGVHRIYLGKKLSGFLYLGTLGFFFIGQFIDLLRLSTMVSFANLENTAFYGGGSPANNTNTVAPVFNISVNVPAAENSEQKDSLTK